MGLLEELTRLGHIAQLPLRTPRPPFSVFGLKQTLRAEGGGGHYLPRGRVATEVSEHPREPVVDFV